MRVLERIRHPIRTMRNVGKYAYDISADSYAHLLSGEIQTKTTRARASAVGNLISVPALEMDLSGLDPHQAAAHLNRLGCLLVRGNDETRAAVADYHRFLDSIGYMNLPIPRGGGLWEFQAPSRPFNFPIHDMIRRHFYDVCRSYHAADLFMSTTGMTATLRTVVADKLAGQVPFHQDISPVNKVPRNLTFWTLIDPDSAGVVAPGLRLVASLETKRFRKIRHTTDDTGYHETRKLGLFPHEFYWTPEIRAGDILIFDPYVCHASYSSGGMNRPRTSVDLRVAAFEAEQARSFVLGGHGLAVFDRDSLWGPTRKTPATGSGFEYGAPHSTAFREALRLAGAL